MRKVKQIGAAAGLVGLVTTNVGCFQVTDNVCGIVFPLLFPIVPCADDNASQGVYETPTITGDQPTCNTTSLTDLSKAHFVCDTGKNPLGAPHIPSFSDPDKTIRYVVQCCDPDSQISDIVVKKDQPIDVNNPNGLKFGDSPFVKCVATGECTISTATCNNPAAPNEVYDEVGNGIGCNPQGMEVGFEIPDAGSFFAPFIQGGKYPNFEAPANSTIGSISCAQGAPVASYCAP